MLATQVQAVIGLIHWPLQVLITT